MDKPAGSDTVAAEPATGAGRTGRGAGIDVVDRIGQLLLPETRSNAIAALIQAGIIDKAAAGALEKELAKPAYGHRAMGQKLVGLKAAIDTFIDRHEFSVISPGRSLAHISLLVRHARAVLGNQLFAERDFGERIVLDFGCGRKNPLGLAIILLANGAKKVVSFEPGPIDVTSCRTAALDLARAIMADPDRFNLSGASRIAMKQRIAAIDFAKIDQLADDSQRRVDFGGIEFVRSVNEPNDEPFGLVLSCSVLEHVTSPPTEISRLRTMMRNGAVGVHIVDFTDHRKTSANYDPFGFYYTDSQPGLNQLRAGDMKSLFVAAGLDVVMCGVKKANPAILQTDRLRDRFRAYDMDDLTTSQAVYVVSAH